MSYEVKIRGAYTEDDGWTETFPAPDGWNDCQTGKCRDCGSEWVWAEAGYVPGTRECTNCESMYSVFPCGEGVATIRRERFWKR